MHIRKCRCSELLCSLNFYHKTTKNISNVHNTFLIRHEITKCQIFNGHLTSVSLVGQTAICFQFDFIFSKKSALTSTYLKSDKKRKMELFLLISQHLFKLTEWHF